MAGSVGVGLAQGVPIWWFASHTLLRTASKTATKDPDPVLELHNVLLPLFRCVQSSRVTAEGRCGARRSSTTSLNLEGTLCNVGRRGQSQGLVAASR